MAGQPILLAEVNMTAKPQSENAGAGVYDRVHNQFSPVAAAYTQSRVHSDPEALRKVIDLARPQRGDRALDIATGPGHVALALAPHVSEMVAYDMTEEMLLETQRNAASRGLGNLATRKGVAERLPFPDATFDVVTVRHAPHHFADVQGALREMARVAKSGARVVVIDSTSPEDESLDRQWNEIEKLRDPSHVCSYQPSKWRAMIAGAGLQITSLEVNYCTEDGRPMSFGDWTRRIKTAPAAVEELRKRFRGASPALAEALRIQVTEEEIGFCVPQIWIAARR